MTLQQIAEKLEKTKMPVAYLSFPADQCPDMPFITYQETGSNNVSADGKVFAHVKKIQVDLFTAKKDPESEETLEAVLNEICFWNKIQTPDEDEACQRYTYEIEIVGG